MLIPWISSCLKIWIAQAWIGCSGIASEKIVAITSTLRSFKIQRSEDVIKLTDIIWKIVVGGSGGVGKTTFLHRYLTKQFLSDTRLTVGVSFQTHKLVRQGKNISMVLWDLGGQERFRFVQGTYIRGAVAAFLMFDLSRMNTLEELKDWVHLIRENASSSVPIVLVGSKYDLISPQNLPDICQEAENFLKNMNLAQFIVMSSKSGENVDETMNYMMDLLLWQKDQGIIRESICQKAPSEQISTIATSMLMPSIQQGTKPLSKPNPIYTTSKQLASDQMPQSDIQYSKKGGNLDIDRMQSSSKLI